MSNWLILALATITAVIGNLSLKKGMMILGDFSLSKGSLFLSLYKVFTQPFIFFGLLFYIVSMFFWLKTLSLFEISKAYPILVGVSFTLVVIGSCFFFKESFSVLKFIGVVVIFLGVLIITKS